MTITLHLQMDCHHTYTRLHVTKAATTYCQTHGMGNVDCSSKEGSPLDKE